MLGTVPASAEPRQVPSHSAAEQRVRRIAHKLLGDDFSSFLGFTPKFQIVFSTRPNAYARKDLTIVLSTALLNLATEDSELAFAMAHEIGHLAMHNSTHAPPLNLMSSSSDGTRLTQEIEADAFALQLIRSSQIFNSDAGASLLARILSEGKVVDTGFSSTYPTLELRIRYLHSTRAE